MGQVLLLHNGTTVVVEEVDSRVQLVRVYNFSVANAHNYFVGGDGVLVHNGDDILLFRAPERGDIGANGQPKLNKGSYYSIGSPQQAAKYATAYQTGILEVTVSKSNFDQLMTECKIEKDFYEQNSIHVLDQKAFNKIIKNRKFIKNGTNEMFEIIQKYNLPFF